MSLPKIADARKLNDEELSDEILAVKRQLFQLRLEAATRRLEKPHLFKHTQTSSRSTIDRRDGTSNSPEAKISKQKQQQKRLHLRRWKQPRGIKCQQRRKHKLLWQLKKEWD